MALSEGVEWYGGERSNFRRLFNSDRLKESLTASLVVALHAGALVLFLLSSDELFVSGQSGADDHVNLDDLWSVVVVEYIPEPKEVIASDPAVEVQQPLLEPEVAVESSPLAEPIQLASYVETPVQGGEPHEQVEAAEATTGIPVEVEKDLALEWIDEPSFSVTPKQPRYPSLAKRRGQQGLVILEIWINEQGKQTLLSVQQSSGFSLLDEAALKAASEWRFKPYLKSGLATASRVLIPLEFSIH